MTPANRATKKKKQKKNCHRTKDSKDSVQKGNSIAAMPTFAYTALIPAVHTLRTNIIGSPG